MPENSFELKMLHSFRIFVIDSKNAFCNSPELKYKRTRLYNYTLIIIDDTSIHKEG